MRITREKSKKMGNDTITNKSVNDMSVITHILDAECTDNVVLYDAKGNAMEFEQVALVPIGEKIGVLMHPLLDEQGRSVPDNELVVFVIQEVNDQVILQECTCKEEIDVAFEAFAQLIEQE